jgi:hypothetical protein
VLVDPDPGVEREAVEGGGTPGVLEGVRETDPAVHLGGLEGGVGVLLEVGLGRVFSSVEQTIAQHLPDHGREDLRDLILRRGLQWNEADRTARQVEDSVRCQGVEVDVQVDGSPEPLDRGYAGGPRIGHSQPARLAPLEGGQCPGEERQEAGGDLGVPGGQEPEAAREREDPLAHGDGGEDVVGEVIGGVLHPPGVA